MDLLKDEVESVGLFEVLDELDDVLVPATMVEGFDLLEHSGPGMAGDFVDDLDCVLDICPDVAAGPDARVGPLA